MFPLTPDYNQQLFAYLQTWRQLLEQWAAMTAGMPFPAPPSAWPTVPFMPGCGQFMPPTRPFMPPMPPFAPQTPAAPVPHAAARPPAPADYTQQLFGYLQAWRQYLEEMPGASGSPQAPTAQQPATGNRPADDTGRGSNRPSPPQQVDIQPESPGGSQIVGGEFGQATPLLDLPPTSGEYVSEFQRPGFDQPSPLGYVPDPAQLLNPAEYAFGYRDRSSAGTVPTGTVVYTAGPGASSATSEAAQLPVASPFSALMERVEPIASPQAEPRSLFSSASGQVASARIEEAGQSPSP
jgi:hypothetical protein